MKTLVLGGTAWLGRTVARYAQERGHEVTCLARSESGPPAEGVTLVTADRQSPEAYDAVSASDSDLVVEVSWQPDMVRSALAAVSERAAHWGLVSTCSVYAEHSQPPLAVAKQSNPSGESHDHQVLHVDQVCAPRRWGTGC